MPKLKTHSGTKDRVKITKNGKVMHGHAGLSHLRSHKNAARKRHLVSSTTMTGKSAKNMKLRLGV